MVASFFDQYSIDTNVARIVEYVSATHDSNTLGFPPQDWLFFAEIKTLRINWPYNFAVKMDDNFQLCTASTAHDCSRRAPSFLAFSQSEHLLDVFGFLLALKPSDWPKRIISSSSIRITSQEKLSMLHSCLGRLKSNGKGNFSSCLCSDKALDLSTTRHSFMADWQI